MESLFNLDELGIDMYDGLLAAFLPPLGSIMQEYYSGTQTAYVQDGVVYDLKDEEQPKVKWWKVKEVARRLRLAIVEPSWSGAACDFDEEHVAQMYHDEGDKLHVRAYSHGPWICIEENKEQNET